MLLAASTRAFEYRFARFFVSFGRFSPPSQCWRLGGLLLMSLTSSVIVVVRKIPVVELFRFKAGIAYWRFPTYVRTEGYLHILRAFGTRSLILRFQSFFSGDANPPFQSWLVFAFLSRRRRVILTQHRLLVIERIDVDAVRRLCFHRLLLLILYSPVRACLCKTNLPS